MKLSFEIDPANVFTRLMDSGQITMNHLIEQLVMDKYYTKNTLSKSAIKELKQLIEYIEQE